MKFILIIILNIVSFFVANAYNLNQISDKEYMSNSAITSLCQDDRGVMWLGTCDGVNTYDGQNIENFIPGPDNDFISGNLIDNIIYTNDNNYWFQTYYGLNRFNSNTGETIHYNEFRKMFFMNKDINDNLYLIQESNCIYYYNKISLRFDKINLSGLPFSNILTFFIDTKNILWIIMDGYTSCYDINQNSVTGMISLQVTKTEFNSLKTLKYCCYDDDMVHYIDHDDDLYTYNVIDGKTTHIYNLKSNIEKSGKISSILKFNNSYFIGFNIDGVLVLEVSDNNYNPYNLNLNSGVFCMKKDRFQDLIWIGTDGQGVFSYSNMGYSINSFPLNNFLPSIRRPVRALYYDDDNSLWVGTKGDGIIKINDYHKDKNIYECDIKILNLSNSDLGNNAVYSFCKSKNPVLWIGEESGLSYYSYKDNIVKKLILSLENDDFKYIHSIYEDDNGYLWLASVGMGIAKVKLKWNNSLPIVESINNYTINNNDFESNYFFTIYCDDDKNILFGNRGYGVFKINSEKNILEPFASTKFENMTLNNVLAINKDDNENYLIGTSYGVIKYKDDSEYSVYNVKNGFLNSTIHSIEKESENNFWLSTNLGLIFWNAEKENFRFFGIKDGLDVVEFSDNASYYDKSRDIMFFGGINGFITITKGKNEEEIYMPSILLSDLSIFGEKQILKEYYASEKESNKVSLNYNQNFFSLTFSAIDYLNGNNHVYYYKFDGINDQWISNGSENTISLTNMIPGNYKLLIKYYNNAFAKESSVYMLEININGPWYKSWWAYLIYSLVILLFIAYLIRSYILKAKLKKQRMLEELEKEHQKNVFESKLQFFTNIAHEFCTPLTLIYGPCQRILSLKGIDKYIVDYVKLIQINSERLNNLIQELIEFRRIETDTRQPFIESIDISALIVKTVKPFSEVAKTRNIKFSGELPEIQLWNTDQEFFTTIITNLVSNAFKYTEDNKSVEIDLRIIDDYLYFKVINDGCSLSNEEMESIFKRYAIIDNLENNTDRKISRNGLGLSISNSMVKLLKGEITVENIADNKVQFIVKLPMAELSGGVSSKMKIAEYSIAAGYSSQVITSLPVYEINKLRPTILIIDDEIEVLWFMCEILSKDYNVIPLTNPLKLDEVLNEMYPDVIICDLMMPERSGIELIKRIKSEIETAHIPVIVVSVKNDTEQQIETLSAGAEVFINKPFDPEFLKVTVYQLMERKEILKNYFNSALSSFDKSEGKLTHKETKKIIQSILKIINANIKNPELSPGFIAEKLSISTRSLYRKMEDVGEKSPTDMIRECRLQMARNLLLTTKKTIDEIVYESGFSNKVTFFKAFKENYNCTPKEYRTKKLMEIDN